MPKDWANESVKRAMVVVGATEKGTEYGPTVKVGYGRLISV